MILDHVRNGAQYFALHEKFEEAFAFLARAEQEALPVGKYELDGDRLYAMVQEYETKDPADGVYEGHEKYIDIQYVIAGKEQIDVTDIENVKATTAYDPERDFALYGNSDVEANCVFEAGTFGIFYPHDIHKPGLSCGARASVRKVVCKVRV